ncbi:MAG: DUF29 domain-containing protein [Thiohalocapsa sp.]|jgi:hypothetical protein
MPAVTKPEPQHSAEQASGRLSGLYEQDYVRWLFENAALLRAGDLEALDGENIAEELEDLARSDVRAVGNHLAVIMLHLLKWQYQPEARSSGWRGSIYNGRTSVKDLLDDSPSLRNRLPALVARHYPRARFNAANETGLPESTFPESCPYTIDQLLSTDFWPEAQGPSS